MSEHQLPRAGILSFMDDESRALLQSYGNVITTLPDQTIIVEGDKQEFLYVVIQGSYEVSTKAQQRKVDLDRVGPGDSFGEIAVFQPGTASATVVSSADGVLWYTNAPNLMAFLEATSVGGCALLVGVNTILSRRLRSANAVIKSMAYLPGFLSVRQKKS